VECLPGGLAQCLVLIRDARLVHRGLHVEHGLFGRLEYCVEPAEHRHRQDHVAVLTADVEVAEHVVGDAPDEVGDPVGITISHSTHLSELPGKVRMKMLGGTCVIYG